ncbi:hypothetical protein ElyMa_002830900 [Elysia marginata]|uniref:Uncharacterized protein n=1 Tax=Elysia marginata TaxID=1093978 RepID=A0AAV4HX76_9GAST|nr:hypothetical protein ElyMa_002830900 [Elysia marginata]
MRYIVISNNSYCIRETSFNVGLANGRSVKVGADDEGSRHRYILFSTKQNKGTAKIAAVDPLILRALRLIARAPQQIAAVPRSISSPVYSEPVTSTKYTLDRGLTHAWPAIHQCLSSILPHLCGGNPQFIRPQRILHLTFFCLTNFQKKISDLLRPLSSTYSRK